MKIANKSSLKIKSNMKKLREQLRMAKHANIRASISRLVKK